MVILDLFKNLVPQVSEIVDELHTSDEEKKQLKIELQRLLLEQEREIFSKEVEDRKSARDLYSTDAFIQKVLAALFTCAYFGLSYVLFRYFVTNNIQLSDYEIGFISTVFGAMSSKVNTIIDFFFGGSSNQNQPNA